MSDVFDTINSEAEARELLIQYACGMLPRDQCEIVPLQWIDGYIEPLFADGHLYGHALIPYPTHTATFHFMTTAFPTDPEQIAAYRAEIRRECEDAREGYVRFCKAGNMNTLVSARWRLLKKSRCERADGKVETCFSLTIIVGKNNNIIAYGSFPNWTTFRTYATRTAETIDVLYVDKGEDDKRVKESALSRIEGVGKGADYQLLPSDVEKLLNSAPGDRGDVTRNLEYVGGFVREMWEADEPEWRKPGVDSDPLSNRDEEEAAYLQQCLVDYRAKKRNKTEEN